MMNCCGKKIVSSGLFHVAKRQVLSLEHCRYTHCCRMHMYDTSLEVCSIPVLFIVFYYFSTASQGVSTDAAQIVSCGAIIIIQGNFCFLASRLVPNTSRCYTTATISKSP